MKKCAKCVFLVLVLTVGFQFLGCVGSVAYREIDLTTDVRSQILNLKNYGDADIDFLRQSERLMKNGFLNTGVEEYGYYLIDYVDLITYYDPVWPYLHAVSLGVLSLIGVPTDDVDYRFEVWLRIYDSNGTEIKNYRKTGSKFTQTAGLYYGHNPTGRVERELRNLFRDVLQMASMQSGEINQALMSAGPVTQEKDSEARSNIASSLRRNPTVTPSYTAPSAPSPAPAQAPAPSTPALQTGRYAWANSGTNMTMTLNSGIVTAYLNNSPIGIWHGTYRINGNQLVITVSVATSDYAGLRGQTYAYTITSSTSFSGSGENWVRTGS